jgi:gliding motility-associated-like protein
VPNAFAPDGVNKMFYPKGQFFDFSLYEMAIYNRWGEQIFITRDVNEGWDGTQNGEIVPLGSYVYTIRFVDADGKEHKRKGTVTVIR